MHSILSTYAHGCVNKYTNRRLSKTNVANWSKITFATTLLCHRLHLDVNVRAVHHSVQTSYMVEGSLAFPLEVIDIIAGQVSGETIV
jgi:hypothetical protein